MGQGDSILIQDGTHFMLVDAGENDQGDTVVNYLKEQGVTSLDYVIGTHPHSDHIGGLDDVLETFPAKTVIMPPVEHTT
ncbi:MAG: MBL fold metallo-hydrolase, partial [Clostridium sp.]